MNTTFRLFSEKPINEEYEYVIEERKDGSGGNVYIEGPYMMHSESNRNRRIYDAQEMHNEVKRYTEEFIKTKRALGELNHPTTPEVDLERACHLVERLWPEGNAYIGRSKVLSTPSGTIVKSLIRDGVQVGVSTRSLGQLNENSDGTSTVQGMKLVAIDCVADPSYPKAYVNGILESKQWICNNNGAFEEVYEAFESKLRNLPRKDVEGYIKNQILEFFAHL